MTVPKIAVCPTCGKTTLLRVVDGGYLEYYPIRVNCMNCKTLIKGIYDPKKYLNGFTLYNAGIRKPDAEPVTINNKNEINIKNADYIAEISGELPCRITQENKGSLPLSLFLSSVDHLNSMPDRINRLKVFVPNLETWNKQKSIAFQLLSDGGIKYISTALNNKIGKYTYECDHYIKSLHCLQEIVLEETKYLFINGDIEDSISNIIYRLSELDKTKVLEFINEINGTEELVYSYRRIIEVFTNFMDIYKYLLPAETYMYFTNKKVENSYISTCSFDDLKSFYQDAYESFASLLYIPVCLDNIEKRGDFNAFSDTFKNVKKFYTGERNLQWYKSLDNGTRVNKIDLNEYYQNIINLPTKVKLRNAIGHNNFDYDGITQIVKAYSIRNKEKIEYEEKLMNIAIDCLNLAKSSVIYSEIILFLLRTKFDSLGIHSIIHPNFYKKTHSYDKCPCGSGLIYKRCCEKTISKLYKLNKSSYFK